MDVETVENLSPELELALAYTPVSVRDRFAALLALDQRLARIVTGTTEPMLGQMRLAWWRDQLNALPNERPNGDPVLEGVSDHWNGSEQALTSLVDAWELMVVTENFTGSEIEQYAQKRSEPFCMLAPGKDSDQGASVSIAAVRFVLADAAIRISDDNERQLFLKYGLMRSRPVKRLPREFRGLAVLQSLAVRSLKNGGLPLMHGRIAALTAVRAAILRR